jgi:hypothetical protein
VKYEQAEKRDAGRGKGSIESEGEEGGQKREEENEGKKNAQNAETKDKKKLTLKASATSVRSTS